MKALIAAACICVIALSGHYAFTQYRQHQDRVSARIAAEQRASAQAAAAKAEKEKMLSDDCDRRVPSQSTDTLKRLHEECLQNNRLFYLD